MFMNECIDSTMGHNPRMLAVLLASDDPKTSWSFHVDLPMETLLDCESQGCNAEGEHDIS